MGISLGRIPCRCGGDGSGGSFQEASVQQVVRMGSLRRIRHETGQEEVRRVGWDSCWQPDILAPLKLFPVSQRHAPGKFVETRRYRKLALEMLTISLLILSSVHGTDLQSESMIAFV